MSVGHVENVDLEDLLFPEPDDDALLRGVSYEDDVVPDRPHLHLVTGPEPISDDDMTRRFLALMGTRRDEGLQTR